MAAHVSDSPTWEEFKREEAKPGLCAVCDRPLTGLKRVLCGARDCVRVFNTIYRRGWRSSRNHFRNGGHG